MATAVQRGVAARIPIVRTRRLAVGLLITFLILLSLYSLSVTGAPLPFSAVLQSLVGIHNQYSEVIINQQLPRVLLCWLVGCSLGVAGGVIQGVIRNPLASPDVIGISKGASVGAAVFLLILPTAPVSSVPIAAFIGGVVAFLLIYVLAYQRGVSPVRLALTGVAIAAVCDSLIRFILVKWPININAALVWLVGSLYGRSLIDLLEIVPWIVVILPLLLFYTYRLDVLSLGDDLASGLGERVERTRLITMLLAVSLASAAVAVAGAIGFVGLVAPHIARRLVGGRHIEFLPLAALTGILLMLVADTLGRGAHPPLEIPAGLITAFIGGPYFLYLLVRGVR
jgi:ferric citrate transport system permease protein